MKRIVTIFLMLSAMLISGNMAYSQNKAIRSPGSSTKKKTISKVHSSNTQKSLSATDFLRKDRERNGFLEFRTNSQIEASLKKAGFTLISKKTTKEDFEWSSGDGYTPGKNTKFVYSKNGTRVEWDSYCLDESPNYYKTDYIDISFKSATERNAFISNLKAYGLDSAFSWIYFVVEGNKVSLCGNWG